MYKITDEDRAKLEQPPTPKIGDRRIAPADGNRWLVREYCFDSHKTQKAWLSVFRGTFAEAYRFRHRIMS